jgi:hypothetical protein
MNAEKRTDKLYIPTDAKYIQDMEWVRANMPLLARPQAAIFKHENVLTSEVLLQVLDVLEEVDAINVNGTTWSSICLRFGINIF